jgi:hypothetical protein
LACCSPAWPTASTAWRAGSSLAHQPGRERPARSSSKLRNLLACFTYM